MSKNRLFSTRKKPNTPKLPHLYSPLSTAQEYLKTISHYEITDAKRTVTQIRRIIFLLTHNN